MPAAPLLAPTVRRRSAVVHCDVPEEAGAARVGELGVVVTVIVLVGVAPVPAEPQAATRKAATGMSQLAASIRRPVIVDALIVTVPFVGGSWRPRS